MEPLLTVAAVQTRSRLEHRGSRLANDAEDIIRRLCKLVQRPHLEHPMQRWSPCLKGMSEA